MSRAHFIMVVICLLSLCLPKVARSLDIPDYPMPEMNFPTPKVPDIEDYRIKDHDIDFYSHVTFYEYADDYRSPLFPVISDYPRIRGKNQKALTMTLKSMPNTIMNLEWAQNAIESKPKSPERFLNRGVVRFNNELYRDALGDFEKALKYGYSRPWVCHYNIALVHWRLGERDSFQESLRIALDLKEDFYRALMIFGDYHYSQADFTQAVEFYDKANEISSSELEELKESKDFDFEREWFLERDIMHIKTRLFASYFFLREFERLDTMSKKVDPLFIMTDSSEYSLWLDRYMISTADPETLDKVCEKLPKRLSANFSSGSPYVKSLVEICRQYRQTKEKPGSEYFNNLASDAYDGEKYQDAVTNYVAAYILSDNEPIIIFNLAMSYYEMDKPVEAAFYLKYYKHLTSDPEADELLADIEEEQD